MGLAPWRLGLHETPLPPSSRSRPRAGLQNPHVRAGCVLWGNRAESKGLTAVSRARLILIGGVSAARLLSGPRLALLSLQVFLPEVLLLCNLQKNLLSSSCSGYLPQLLLKPVTWRSLCLGG